MKQIFEAIKTNKKKALLFGGIGLLILVLVIIGIIFLVSLFRRYDYHEIENLMVRETKNYLRQNQTLSPTEDNPTATIEASTLISEKYLKDFSKLSRDSNCDGYVTVVYTNGYLRYEPNLTCANYSTLSLADQIISQEEIKEENAGLYSLNDYYTYRGENINNYVTFAGALWRIVKFNEEEMMLVLNNVASEYGQMIYDDRYNQTTNSNRGYNSFNVSRIEETLDGIYNDYFANYKNYLLVMDACIDQRSETDQINTGSTECRQTYETPISLLATYDYINASIDPYCRTTSSGNCANYNYLSEADYSWWLLNGTDENNYEVYVVNTRGNITLSTASARNHLRVVITIPSQSLYKSGNGSVSSPYEIYQF